MKKILLGIIITLVILTTLGSFVAVDAAAIQTGAVIDGYEYFIVDNSKADPLRMRVPHLANATPSHADGFYNSAEGKTGAELKTALNNITKGPYVTDYGWSRFDFVDEDPNKTSNIWTVYGSQSLSKSAHVSGGNTWNREHSYPQSFFGEKAPMVSDTNHIYADDWKTNGVRGNKPFGDIDNVSSNEVLDSDKKLTANFSNASFFEPMDAVKGQVARATLYMYVRYNLAIETNFQSLDLCLAWNNEFPVTTWEIERNNRVDAIQGNRNPFIDHPEFASRMFNPSSPVEPNQAKINEVINSISSLPVNITLSDEEAVNSANTLYTNLTTAEKALVTNYTKLSEAVLKIKDLKENPVIPDTVENRFIALSTKALLEVKYNFNTQVSSPTTPVDPTFVQLENLADQAAFDNAVKPGIINITESAKHYPSYSGDIKGVKLGSGEKGVLVIDFPESSTIYNNIAFNISPWQKGGNLTGEVETSTVRVTVTTNSGATAYNEINLTTKDIVSLSLDVNDTIKKIRIEAIKGKRFFIHNYTLNPVKGPQSTTTYTINSSKLKFGAFDLPKEFYDLALSGDASFGIIYSQSNLDYTTKQGTINDFKIGNIKTYSSAFTASEMAINEQGLYQFSIALDYKLEGIEQYNKYSTVIYSAVYMEYNGSLYFMSKSQNSVNSLANKYITDYRDLETVKDHIGMLEKLGKYTGDTNE